MIEIINNVSSHWWGWMAPMFWQAALLILVVGAIDALARKWVWPQVRYGLWLLVLVKLVLPPSLSSPASLAGAFRQASSPEASRREIVASVEPVAKARILPSDPGESMSITGAQFSSSAPVPASFAPPQASLSWKSYLMAGWLVGVAVLGSWALARLRSLRRDYGDGQAAPASWKQMLGLLAARIKLRRTPALVFSRNALSPAVFGVFRPVIVMPEEFRDRASDEETRHALLHELAHIKRGDLFLHAFFMLLQVVYWFHPLLWLVRRRTQHARELCCDATVAALLRERAPEYRQTLLRAAERLLAEPRRPAVPGGLGLLGLVERPSNLLARIRWLERGAWRHRKLRLLSVVLTVGVMLATVLPMAKSASKQSGETASAREADADVVDTRILHFPPDRSLGTISIRDAGSSDYRDSMNYRSWEKLGDAKGNVEVPAGKDARLQVAKEAALDLALLNSLGPNDLRSLSLHSINTHDIELEAIERLTGLRQLIIIGTPVSDAGLIHLRPLKALESLHLSEGLFTDAGLEHLAGLTRLEELDLRGCKIKGDGFKHLARLSSLHTLNVGSNEIDDEGMRHLPKLKGLRNLHIWYCPITNASLPYLGSFTWLEKLDLWGTKVTNAGMTHLDGMVALRWLRLDNTVIGDAGLKELRKLPALEELRLQNTGVTDLGLAHLKGHSTLRLITVEAIGDEGFLHLGRIPSLKYIDATATNSRSKVTEKGIEALKNIPLEHLQLAYCTTIGDQAIPAIAELQSLKFLGLNSTKVSDAGIPPLKKLKSLKELRLTRTQITDKSVEVLKEFTQLEILSLSSTRVTEFAAAKLKAALPNCDVRAEGLEMPPVGTASLTVEDKKALQQFQKVYQLEENEVLRFIPLPFIPEREVYYRVKNPQRTTGDTPDMLLFHWEDRLKNWGESWRGGGITPLKQIVTFGLGLTKFELEGPEELLELDLSGDWIVMSETEMGKKLKALEGIVREKLGRDIRFVKRRVERETIVVSGRYEQHPVPNPPDSAGKSYRKSLHIYGDGLNADPNRGGGGSGDLNKFIQRVGNRLERYIINETEPNNLEVSVRDHDSGRARNLKDDPVKIRRVLDNLEQQTSFEFKIENRKVDVWFVSEKASSGETE